MLRRTVISLLFLTSIPTESLYQSVVLSWSGTYCDNKKSLRKSACVGLKLWGSFEASVVGNCTGKV